MLLERFAKSSLFHCLHSMTIKMYVKNRMLLTTIATHYKKTFYTLKILFLFSILQAFIYYRKLQIS